MAGGCACVEMGSARGVQSRVCEVLDPRACSARGVVLFAHYHSAPGCYDGRSRLVPPLPGPVPDDPQRRGGAGPLRSMRQTLFPDQRCLRGDEHVVRPARQQAVWALPSLETARAGGAEPRAADGPAGAGGRAPVGAGGLAASVVPAGRRDSAAAKPGDDGRFR